MSTAPHVNIDPQAFWRDPYPALAAMRREAPICFVPQLGSTLLTRRDDVLVGSASRADGEADGSQHDAQGRRCAHGGALDLLSGGIAKGRARALARGISGARGSHPRRAGLQG